MLVVRLIAMSIAGWVLHGEALAEPPPTEDSLVLFEELVRNPDNVRANLAYARALEAEGRIEDARTVYQKVLTLSPNNPTAVAALASLAPTPRPAQTDYTFRTGGAIETNDARRDPNFRPFFDTLGFAEFTVNDLRQFGDVKLQSNIDIFSNIHNRYSPGNISYFLIDSGPLFELHDGAKLRTAAGAEYVLQGPSPIDGYRTRDFEFSSGNFILNYIPPGNPPLQSVNLLAGYNSFRSSGSFRSGPVIRMMAPILLDGVLPFSSSLLATPGYVLNGARQPTGEPLQPAHYNEANLELITFTPMAENQLWSGRVVGIVGVFLAGDIYNSHSPGQSGDRRDARVIPRVGLRLLNFANTSLQVDFDYRYDRNFSTEFAESYEDNIFSLTFTYRF
ncbi:MAG: tetratricopeptide repeat protein [Alphaproteobacteria bacterium]|nr:tetratricopeptide repeat protein [Alphaproteobacteria bacterium]